MSEGKPKKKTGLFIAGGIAAVIVIGGGVVGAAVMGVIKIPGLTPKGKGSALYGEAAKMYGEGGELAIKLEDPDKKASDPQDKQEAESKPSTPAPAKKPAVKKAEAPTTDPELGAKKLAQVWNGIDPIKLALISEEYSEKDLAMILNKMDAGKVAKLLAELEPKKAATISKRMQELGSVLPTPASS